MGFLLRLVINAVALWIATQIVPGVSFQGGAAAFLVAALIFGVVNATLRPITKLLTCPLILVTFGLFALVVNGLMFWLASTLTSGMGINLRVTGFWPAFWGALVVSIVSALLSQFVRHDEL